MGVATGCGCKEVYRFPNKLMIYTVILDFWHQNILVGPPNDEIKKNLNFFLQRKIIGTLRLVLFAGINLSNLRK